MPLFGLLDKREAPPQWAGFFTFREYRAFIALVHDYFRSQQVDIAINDGVVTFHEDGHDWPPAFKCGLLNLAQSCRQAHKRDWKQSVFQHFENLRKVQQNQKEFEEQIKNFYLAYNLLAVRLWPEKHMETVGEEKCIVHHDLDGIISTLAFDLPSAIRQVRPQDVALWDRPIDELFEIGLSNVRKMPRPRMSEVDIGDNIKLTLFSGDSFYVATYALLLKYYPSCVGTHGSLISVPTRHVVLCYPIQDINAIKAAHSLILVTNGIYNDGPGAISSNLYWYREDKFTLFPYEIVDKTLAIKPPDIFMKLLEGLV
jgi:hypothetical protein